MSARGYKQSGGYFTVVGVMSQSAVQAQTLPCPLLANFGTETAPLMSTNSLAISSFTSTLLQPGNAVRDMGKTLVSTGRTFRKIQLIGPTGASNGIGGTVQSGIGQGPNPDYWTGYVELPNTDSAATGNAVTQTKSYVARLG